VIANPDADDAVVDLVPHLPNGALVAETDEIFVPRRSTVARPVKFSAAQGLPFSVEAVARTSRFVVGGVITHQGQPSTFVPGQSTPRSSWSFAGGFSGNGHQTTLLVSNPSTSPLQVSARVIGDKGAFDLHDPAFDKPIPSGALAQIPINPPTTASSPASGGSFGLQVSSRDGTHYIAALRVSSALAGAQQVAYVDPGTALPDRSWLVPGATGGKVVLVNTSDSAVTAQLIPVGGQPSGQAATRNGGKAATGTGRGATAPPPTQALTLPPGRVVVRDVPGQVDALDVEAGEPGVLVALLGEGEAIPGAVVGGVPAGGPVVQGPAAS